jgi:hypothetical protein
VGKGNIDEAGNIDKAVYSAWFHPFWVPLRNRVHFQEPVLFGKVYVNLSSDGEIVPVLWLPCLIYDATNHHFLNWVGGKFTSGSLSTTE